MKNKDFDIVFLAGLFPKETESQIISNSIGSIHNAANNLQWSMVRGLDDHLKLPVTIINSLYIGSFPRRYKELIIREYKFKHSDFSEDINVGFINLSGFKHLSRYLSLRPHIRKWATNKSGKRKVIIAYALTNIFVELLCLIKKEFPDIVTLIIVPDLPQYMDTTNNSGFIYKLLKTSSVKHIMNNINKIDGFVLLTKDMAGALGLKSEKAVVIEGISNSLNDNRGVNVVQRTDVITIAYTGTLNERYGIITLVKAFMRIKNTNYRLVLCGSGDSEQFISVSSRKDDRIIFRGLLRHDEIIEIQNSSTILVNPRQNNEVFTKYSFPSKNMEYLSSGRPLVAYKLDGIPDEYDNHIFYVPDNSIEALSHKMLEVCSNTQEYLTNFGISAKNWVLKEKNCIVQTRKIIDMISAM